MMTNDAMLSREKLSKVIEAMHDMPEGTSSADYVFYARTNTVWMTTHMFMRVIADVDDSEIITQIERNIATDEKTAHFRYDWHTNIGGLDTVYRFIAQWNYLDPIMRCFTGHERLLELARRAEELEAK